MKVFADLHIHSHYSRATSDKMNISELEKFAKIKGLNLLGTGDFTHPAYFKELKSKLNENGTGILKTKSGFSYMLQTEVANFFFKNNISKKVHNIIFAPSFAIAEQINEYLSKFGSLSADGRPMLKLSCSEMTEALMQISKEIMVIPAHAWTPWFSVFGSKSGFDNIKDCFEDQTKNIFAIETGLSSDPVMNWRLSQLDKIALISNSDCHSPYPWRLGRELNVFEMRELTYKNLTNAIKEKDPKKFLYTIEVDPNYGKYHFDGHRNCRVFLSPAESEKYRNTCPVCKRQLTIGVLHRVEELADREEGYVPKNAVPFKSLLPLYEVISYVTGTNQLYSKKVVEIQDKLIGRFGTELNVLLEADINEIKKIVDERIAQAIMKNREGKIKIQPGYDGVYGKPIFDSNALRSGSPQKRLDKFFKNQ